jgi:hypothetical protein
VVESAMEMELFGRNTVWGIRDRTLKNLDFIISARTMGADVHVITALITSLLGLIIFPYQEIQDTGAADFKNYDLETLSEYGWPKWNFGKNSSCHNLHDLVRHLRNSASHPRIIFGSHSRELSQVDVLFFDRKNPKGPDDWDATINAAELHAFVLLFARFLKQWQTDYS